MYNTFECHFKPNQKSQSDMVDPVLGCVGFMIQCISNNFIFFKPDLQKGQNFYKEMHDLGIIQNVQQYPKLLRISWRNCL